MKIRSFLLYIYAATCMCAQAQLHTPESTIDFGEIGWHNPRSRDIQFQNKSRHAVILTDVRTDCGCTTARWVQGQLIEPGQRTTIRVTYDAQTLGRFQKGLRIYTQERTGTKETSVWIKGNVFTEVIDYTQDYPYAIGEGIYLTDSTVEFDDVKHGERPQQQLRIVNGTKQNFEPTLMHVPSWLQVKCEPEVLRPGKSGVLTFTANAGAISRYGLTQTSVYVSRHLGDKVGHDNEVQVSLTMLPQVSGTASDLSRAPRVEVDSIVELSASGAKKARRIQGTVLVRNMGQSDLEVSRLQVYNLGLQVSLSRSTIKPGKSATLRVSGWAADDLRFKGRRRILLITNDPVRPKITIDVK